MKHTDARPFDVAVIGGGPAGSAAGITLSRFGYRVVLAERTSGRDFKIGESLSPSAKPLLSQLGISESMLSSTHIPCFGNVSLWGDSRLASTEFIKSPYGHGYHLDRAAFDCQLRAAANQAGVDVREGSEVVQASEVDPPGWRLTLISRTFTSFVEATWLVDCTGRVNLLGRRLRLERLRFDRLVAYFALFVAENNSDCDSRTITEAAADGWWYNALLPNRQRMVVYFTGPHTVSSIAARNKTGFLMLLRESRLARESLDAHRYAMLAKPQAVPANSEKMARSGGRGWIAAGDASMAFDPLSSMGIEHALVTGIRAASAIHAQFLGDPASVERYHCTSDEEFGKYLEARARFYKRGQRSSKSTFWD